MADEHETMAAVAGLRWHRVAVRLRNERNVFARQHTLFTLRALLKTVNGTLGLSGEQAMPPAVFRLKHPVADRIRHGTTYSFDLVFRPCLPREVVEGYREALRLHCRDAEHNFSLVECGPAEPRDLGALVAGSSVDWAAPEVCLDFHTPCAFTPKDKARHWMITPSELGLMLARRVEKFFGIPSPAPPAPGCAVLSWFWTEEQHGRKPKSGGGQREDIRGCAGPLYLRGDLARVKYWLLLAEESLLGRGTSKGQGAFVLRSGRTFFDRELPNRTRYEAAWKTHVETTDEPDSFTHALADPGAECAAMAGELDSGTYAPAPAKLFFLPKRHGGIRPVVQLSPRDLIAQRVLHEMLNPVLDRAMEEASVGFRAGRSVETARRLILEAIRDGYDHVVESDIESFFDDIPWTGLEQSLDAVLPRADTATRSALSSVVRQPVVDAGGRALPREKGILQGSPLSPMLANIYLDTLDEEMLALGFRFIRYGDDFVILARGQEAAARALEAAADAVRRLGLTLCQEKTVVRPSMAGFRFLGMDLGKELEEEFVERTALRRPIIFREQYGFAGVDHDSLVLRRDKVMVARVPLLRVGRIAFHGSFGLSTNLLRICAEKNIPVSICGPTGAHINTIRPDSRRHHETAGRHARAFDALSPSHRLALAAAAVEAKLLNQATWLAGLRGGATREPASWLVAQAALARKAGSVEELLGVEGQAARTVFPVVNGLVADIGFPSAVRKPHEKPDRWNSLLDFGYTQLFHHLNVIVRCEGLNPYLGFLHSPDDRFESLVADLQEPFRPRVDRWAVRLVRRKQITPDHFAADGSGRTSLVPAAYPLLLEAFAEELSRVIRPSQHNLLDLLTSQVLAARSWADHGVLLRFYHEPRP